MFQPGKGDARRARRFLRRNGDELAFELIDHKQADLLGKRGSDGEPPPLDEIEKLERFREVVAQERSSPHRLRDLAVDGNDLIRIGFRPGPHLGRILYELLDAVVRTDRSAPAVAVLHVGWRGLLGGIVASGVEALGDGRLAAAIGPGIGPYCYEVGEEVAAPFRERFGADVVRDSRLDLWTSAE